MKTLCSAFLLVLFTATIALCAEAPLKRMSRDFSSNEDCEIFINQTKKELKGKGMLCRSILGVVHACDSSVWHYEMACTDRKATVEIFGQDGSDWKRFYN